MQLLRLAFKFFLYRLKSFRLHGVHSPFVFDLYEHIIRHKGHFAAYTIVEKLRQKLLKNHQKIEITDLGAGSKNEIVTSRSISNLARISAKSPKYAQLLFRLVNYFQPKIILELGTSLGLTTAYLAKAKPTGKVFTFEGCPNIAAQALLNFDYLGLANIRVITGNLNHTLAKTVPTLPQLDFVFFDGNHQYEPTIEYFKICLLQHTPTSVFVFDDIYWSAGMEKAWREICRHPAVTLSIDLFHVGLVFFRPQQPKQHLTLWF